MENELEIRKTDYSSWKDDLINQIHLRQLKTVININSDTLQNYFEIGKQILAAQNEKGWGSHVIDQLSVDLEKEFGKGKGYSVRNLKYMRIFAEEYPDFPVWKIPISTLEKNQIRQVTPTELKEAEQFVQVPLAQITWYHHISLISKVKDKIERAFYITETAQNGWSRDIMLLQVESRLYERKGKSINNFPVTLPPVQSDLAVSIFKDPYNFGFVEFNEKQNELDIERQLTKKINAFLLEMGKGFAYIGRQYHIIVDGDDYYIDLLMYHTRLHCYVVLELKAVEFIPEFVSKLNFYISAIDEQLKMPEDKPTIGLLLCRSKSNVKAEYSLRGITQPLGIAEYEIQKVIEDIKSSIQNIEEMES